MKPQQHETKINKSFDGSQESGFMKRFWLEGRVWSKIKLWRQVSAQLNRLRGLDDYIFKDIGLSRVDAEREASRYFWDYPSNRDATLRKRGEVVLNENGLTMLECSNCQC